jgi:hypothetical protein
MLMRMPLTSFDQVPDKFYEFVHVEYKMPATTVSHAVIRSISVTGCDAPPEKYANYVSLYEYLVDLTIIHANDDNPYNLAVNELKKPASAVKTAAPIDESEQAKHSDDSDDYYYNYDEEDDDEEEVEGGRATVEVAAPAVESKDAVPSVRTAPTASPARPPPPTRST